MNPTAKGGVRLAGVLALATGTWISSSATAEAGDGLFSWLRHDQRPATEAAGTLGYGPPGPHPGFQGFGLGFHRGHGYGGEALGVGAQGGYPFHGGPGYLHPGPRLNRLPLTRNTPFPFHGGPGGPTPDQPQYYDGGANALVVDQPVVSTPGADENGYGSFSGMIPYPDSAFASFTAEASGVSSRPGQSLAPSNPALLTPNPSTRTTVP
jgi:hypothetical protein